MPETERSLRKYYGWIFIAVMLGFSAFISFDYIGRFTVLRTIFDWPRIQAFLTANNEGFLIGALVGIYLEIVRPNSMSALFATRLDTLDSFIRRSANIDGIRFFLERVYGNDPHLADLAESVISSKPVLYESRLEIAFQDSPRSDSLYIRHNKLSFDADFDQFTLGFARTAAIAERLIHDGPDMTEVVVADHEPLFARSVENILKSRPVHVNGDPLEFVRPANLKALPSRGSPIKEGEDYLIVTSTVPKSRTGNPRRHMVIEYQLTGDRLAGHHYWIADRPMFVREISIGLIGLTGIDRIQFEVLSFLGSVEDIGELNLDKGKISIHVDHWLLRGQGICVIWRQAKNDADQT